MKKIFILSFLLCLSVSLMAQRASSTTAIGAGTLKTLTLTAADTITQGGTAYWTFNVNQPDSYYFCFAAAIDTVTHATNRLSCTIWGSMDNTNFVNTGITQVNIYPTAGGGADTTFQMTQVTTPVLWKYLKFRLVSLDANVVGAKLSGLSLKIGDAHK
jgi:hypothetical protein